MGSTYLRQVGSMSIANFVVAMPAVAHPDLVKSAVGNFEVVEC